MTTATQNQAVSTPAAVDFETRLTLAAAGMDAILAHRHGVTLAEARQAVREAQEAPVAGDEIHQRFTPNAVLRAAGDLIRVRGHHQGAYESPGGALCALGAVRVASRGDLWMHESTTADEVNAVHELTDRIRQTVGDMSVPEWNDSRSSADVLKLLY